MKKTYRRKIKKKKLGKKILLSLIVLIISIALIFKAYRYATKALRTMNFIKIKEISIVSPPNIDKAKILKLSGIREDSSILEVSVNELKRRISTHPWINNVVIKRIFPSRIEITVDSKEVRALAKINNALYYIDGTGKIIDKFTPGYKSNMPIINTKIEDYPKVIRLLDKIESMPISISEILLEEADTLIIYPSGESIKFRIKANNIKNSFISIQKVLMDLRKRNETATIIDATLPGNKIIVKGIRQL